MKTTRKWWTLPLLLALGLLLATAVRAATFDILVDKDSNSATGCTVATPDGPFTGVEFIVTTTVNTGVYPPMVSGVTRADCASPPSTFGPPTLIDAGGWPVGIGSGTAGYDVLETWFPIVAPYGQYRLGFVYTDPNTGSDALITSNGQAGAGDIFFELGPFPIIPTLAHGTLLLLAFALAWFALRRLRQHKVSTLVFCGVLASIVAGTTWAAIVLNGLIDDWTGVPQLAGDPTGDAPGGADMAAVFVLLENPKIFVRVDVKTASPPSFTSAAATTFTVGTAGNFAITTFGIPAVTSITQGGALPTGVSFVYTPGQSTAALSGIPGAGTGGIYPLTFGAVNGVPPPGSQNFTLTVNQAPAITSAGSTAFTVGTPGSFTFTASGFPAPALTLTGCVPALPGGLTVTDNGNGTATLAGSAALGSVGVKNCTLTASNGVGAPVAAPFALTINQAPTTTTVVSNINPSLIGQSVTFTATVVATPPGSGTPTGSVQFRDAGNPIGAPVALAGGTAAFSTAALALGAHAITVDYLGDVDFLISSGALPTQTVNKTDTTTTVTSDVNPSVFGQPVTFTATVAANPPGSGTPTGTVQFMDGITPLGAPVALVAGTASLSTSALATGAHPITVNYGGDPNFNASAGTLPTQTVNKANTTNVLNSAPNPSVFGQNVTLTATVAVVAPGAGVPTGTVNFFDGITNIGNSPLVAGVATLNTAALAVNAHMLTAQYAGDVNFNVSTSNTVGHTVNKAASNTALGSSLNPSLEGQAVTFTATVTAVAPGAGIPGGTVQFMDGATPLGGPVALVAGVATINTSALLPGVHSMSVTYGGDASFNGSSSAPLVQTINKAPAAVDDPDYIMLTGTTLTITAAGMPPGLLANDSLGFPAATVSFFGGGDVSALVTDNPAGAPVLFGGHSLQVDADGGFTFIAAAGSYGNVTFQYRLHNSAGDSDATVTIGIHKAPLFTSPATASFQPGLPGTFTVTTSGFPFPAITTGPFTPAAPWLSLTDNGDGTATLAGTPPALATGSITFTLTAQNIIAPPATQNFTLQLQAPPAITSANATTFQTTVPGTFTVTTTGFPTGASMVIGQTGALPAGTVAFVNNNDGTATLAGTANAGQGGVYPLVITANNGVPPAASQNFTLTVNDAPGTPSGPTPVTFVVGTLNTATYTATGYPLPTFTLTGCPTLPPAITLSPTGLLSGTAVAGTGGDYNCTVNASNGIGVPTTLPIVVQVREAPAFTSANTLTCVVGTPCPTLNVTASGFPAPTLTAGVCTPALPAPVAFTGSGTTTMSLGGTPPALSGGTYSCALTASNGVGSNANQTLVVTINQPPAITSANSAVFTEGLPGTFTVTTTGFPTNASMVITQGGAALPGALTFTNNNNGTATLAGTPNAATAGLYVLTITANNGIGAPAVQNPLNLRVCPIITIGALSSQPTRTNPYTASVTAVGGTGPYTYAITAAPSPLTGATLGSNGVFSGTVTAAGPYSFTITATDANGCTGSTPFSGTINEPPTVVGESYQVVGNTPLRVAASDGVTVPHLFVASTNGVLANDNNGNGGGPGGGISAVAGTFATTGGGSITLAADGTFTYAPPIGFTGADTYVYTVSDGVGIATGTVTLNVSTMIWYVKNDVALTGNGSAGSPFKTLAETVTPSAINDTIYLFTGDGTTTGQNAGIVLENGQRLIGQGAALTALGTFNTILNPTLQAAGSAPIIGNSGGNGITLASGNTIRGLTVGATTATKIFGNAFGTLVVGNTTTPDVALTGAGKLLDLTNGTFDATSAFSSIASTSSAAGQHGLKLDTVHGTVAFGSTTINNSGIQGIFIFNSDANVNFGNTVVGTIGAAGSGGGPGAEGIRFESNTGGTRTFGTLAISESTAQGITIAGVGIGGGLTVVTGQTTITNPGNVGILIAGAALGHGTTFANVTVTGSGSTGVSLSNNLGTVTFADLDITPDSGQKGLLSTYTVAGTPGTITATSGTISTLLNTAVEVTSTGTNQPLAMVLDSVSSTGGVNNVLLTRISGSLAMNAGALSGSTGVAFGVSGSTATVGYAGSITNATGGISLTSNTGGTINFTGGMNLSTGANPAFTATGGGTVSATQNNTSIVNTLATTTGTALNVANTTIGASGLTFRSISANGGAKGIILNTTGSSGAFTVTGTGTTAGTGGTIQNTTTRGAEFVSANSITLTNMNFTNNAQSVQDVAATCANLGAGTNLNCSAGIHMATVNGFTLDKVDVNGSNQVCINGNNVTTFSMTNSSQVRNCGNEANENGMQFANLLGTSTITGVTFSNNYHSALDVVNTVATAGTLNVTSASFTGNGIGTHGSTLVKYSGDGTANMTINVQSSSFNGSNSYGYFTDTATTAHVTSTINNSTFGTVSANALGIQYVNSASSDIDFTVTNNTIVGGNALNGSIAMVGFSETGSTTASAQLKGTFTGNTIGTNAVVGSGCSNGCSGVGVFPAGAGEMNLTISNNTIRQVSAQGISLSSNAGTTGTLTMHIKGNTIDQPQAGFSAFLRAISLTPGNSGGASPTSCFEVGGPGGGDKNTISAGWQASSAVRVNNANNTGTTRFPGYIGVPTADATLESFVEANNTMAAGDAFVTSSVAGISGGAACPL
ncbi:MAG: Ig-like domain repeat protein [Betaproteobacteria bacterium]|nr:Ig-like domain repeat protein [Betaproteobacteria bacterium]